MSPAQTLAILIIALALDFWSVGPNSIRDRVAFFMALAGFYVGFRNSSIAKTVIESLNNVTEETSKVFGDAYVAQGIVGGGLTIFTIILFFYTILCLAPTSMSSKLGPRANKSFNGGKMRVNWQLWACAFLLAILAEVPKGWLGGLIRFIVQLDVTFWSAVARTVFGIF